MRTPGAYTTGSSPTAACGVFPELPALDDLFRSFSHVRQASPRVWVDAYLAAHASANEAIMVTFDQAFAKYGVACRILH